MGPRRVRSGDRALRPAMRSPGRPPGWRREHLEEFWEAIARGVSSEDAAVAAGFSPALGARLFRQAGGMRTISPTPVSGRYLSFAEREEIAILNATGCGVREIASELGRSPSTISRELRRNAATRSGSFEYRATTAQWHAARRAKRNDHPRASRSLARPATWSPKRPALGYVMESGADLKPPARRLSL